MENKIKVFENREVRTVWNADEEEWYFSVVDVVAVLTDSKDPKQYIKKMRSRDSELASKWCTLCTPVAMAGLDGKRRKIQVSNTKNILRIIQSIPSPKAEPFKVWLAHVGSERLDEIEYPVALHVRMMKHCPLWKRGKRFCPIPIASVMMILRNCLSKIKAPRGAFTLLLC